MAIVTFIVTIAVTTIVIVILVIVIIRPIGNLPEGAWGWFSTWI